MTDITHIPLNKLTAWEGNVRKTQNRGGIDELAASIAAHGLLQSLVVRKDGRKFAVVAGNRRLAALGSLLKAGKIGDGFEVPCQVIEKDADAMEISLAENTIRENMHPADECDAYRDLIDKGTPIADVASRFGKTETYVQQRLKLARVNPVVIKAYRKGDLTLEHVQAFAVSDDHEAQESALQEFDPQCNDAGDIRGWLTERDISTADRRVRYVTLKAYEKAGGTLRRDLFSQDDDSVFILDEPLLDKLVHEKLDRAAKTVQKEGWKWVEVREEFDYRAKAGFSVVREQLTPLSANKQAELESLQQEYEELEAKYLDSEDAERPERLDDIGERIEKLNEGREEYWPPETLAIAGAVICLDYHGMTDITRGLVRPEDAPKKPARKDASAPAVSGEDAGSEDIRSEFSAGLIRDLTAQRSAAITAELQQRPDIALAAVVHAMALQTFRHGHSRNTCLRMSVEQQSFRAVEGSKASAQIDAAGTNWGDTIPGQPEDLWKWCLEQNQNVLLDLMAFCAASTIDAVMRDDGPDSGRQGHANYLAAALGLDMKTWFTPTADNYFSRVSKPQILEAIREAKGQPPAPAWEKLKKGDLAKEAERQIAGTGWLPKLLR